ncbi:MAG TPA: hypothetical protein VNW25_03965, partial [Candidatus Sulfotelmatobacter sp.]|nr:hypothetical protein [Candidatus Sulfotelmatobacter sp.]
EHFKEIRELQQSQPTLVDSLQQYRELQGLIGASPDKPEIAMKKLELLDKREQREFEHSVEAGKQKAQSQMLNGVVGALSKLAESPLIKEAGRGIGQALGKTSPRAGAVVDAVTRAPQTAARAELNTPPTETPWGLVCHKCKQQTIFSQLQLARIEEAGGRWSCGTCGEVYELRRSDGGDTSGST